MKKLLVILGLALTMTSVSAAPNLKICAIQANEVCSEITDREDFQQCHNAIMQECLDYSSYKSVPACQKYCETLPEATQRAICLQTCSPL